MKNTCLWKLCAVPVAVVLAVVLSTGAEGKGNHKGKEHAEGTKVAPPDIKPDVFNRLLKDNPGLEPNFLDKEPPDKMIKLADGKEWPLYQLKQFLNHNFRWEWVATKKEGENIVKEQNWKTRRIMANPVLRDFLKTNRKTYKVHGKAVDWEHAYSFLRNLHNTVKCGVSHPGMMPVGGGGHAMAPSWAVWKKLNLIWHECANATPGFSGDEPVMTGVLAGYMEKWDKKKLWKYPTVDVNTCQVTNEEPPVTGFDTVDKGAKNNHHKK